MRDPLELPDDTYVPITNRNRELWDERIDRLEVEDFAERELTNYGSKPIPAKRRKKADEIAEDVEYELAREVRAIEVVDEWLDHATLSHTTTAQNLENMLVEGGINATKSKKAGSVSKKSGWSGSHTSAISRESDYFGDGICATLQSNGRGLMQTSMTSYNVTIRFKRSVYNRSVLYRKDVIQIAEDGSELGIPMYANDVIEEAFHRKALQQQRSSGGRRVEGDWDGERAFGNGLQQFIHRGSHSRWSKPR